MDKENVLRSEMEKILDEIIASKGAMTVETKLKFEKMDKALDEFIATKHNLKTENSLETTTTAQKDILEQLQSLETALDNLSAKYTQQLNQLQGDVQHLIKMDCYRHATKEIDAFLLKVQADDSLSVEEKKEVAEECNHVLDIFVKDPENRLGITLRVGQHGLILDYPKFA